MPENFATEPPLVTADLPGIGGRIKVELEDFEVEEMPAYEPCGQGEFLYLWIEKRDMGGEFFQRQIGQRLGIAAGDLGTAGLKDRRAVTRQWVSVPASAEGNLTKLEGDGIRVLSVSRHTNKLRTGHLHGNRFRILIRHTAPEAAERLPPLLDRLRGQGMPNFYGCQRFGHDAETLAIGLALLRGERIQRRVGPFLKKLALSAAQSALFNHYLGCRVVDGLLRRVLPGDVMAKYPFGGMFVAEDVAAEQARLERRDIVSAGPIFGRKTFPARGEAAQREAIALATFELERKSFEGFGKLVQGTRRHNLIYLDDLLVDAVAEGMRLSFSLPAGSYATVLLREIMKSTEEAPIDAT